MDSREQKPSKTHIFGTRVLKRRLSISLKHPAGLAHPLTASIYGWVGSALRPVQVALLLELRAASTASTARTAGRAAAPLLVATTHLACGEELEEQRVAQVSGRVFFMGWRTCGWRASGIFMS